MKTALSQKTKCIEQITKLKAEMEEITETYTMKLEYVEHQLDQCKKKKERLLEEKRKRIRKQSEALAKLDVKLGFSV